MQALTGLFARQFGTPNYATHGGFCSFFQKPITHKTCTTNELVK